jgi:hypothetical protein
MAEESCVSDGITCTVIFDFTDCLENFGASTSHNLMRLHGLLEESNPGVVQPVATPTELYQRIQILLHSSLIHRVSIER